MYRIDNATAATTLPAPSAPGPQVNGFFTGGSSTVSPTRVDAEWLNMQQEEIANVILAAGIALNKGDRTQLLQALQGLGRRKLTANADLYVAPGGSDAASGSAAAPFATLQHAWDVIIGTLDLNGFNVTVHVADGTYGAGLVASGLPVGFGGGNSLAFLGDTTAPSNCTVNVNNHHCLQISDGADVQFSGLRLIAAGTVGGTPASLIVTGGGSVVTIAGNMDFSNCGGNQLWIGGACIIRSGYQVSGPAQAHLYANGGGNVIYAGSGLGVTVINAPTFSTAFATAFQGGNIQAVPSTVGFSGTAHGPRYSASLNATIWTNGAGATYFPGDAAGTVATGGQYA